MENGAMGFETQSLTFQQCRILQTVRMGFQTPSGLD
jgi:hypothetical protein